MPAPLHFSAGLEKYPELATEIGRLVADYAALEMLLFETYVAVSLNPPQGAFSDFFTQRSINNKTKLLIDAAETLPPPYRTAVKRIVRRMKGAAARRTEITHVHFMDVGQGPMRIHLVGESVKVTPLTNEFLKRTADQYRTLGIDLIAFASSLMAGNPHSIAKSEAATFGLNEQLQRTQRPPEYQSPLSRDEIAAADARLGLDGFLGKGWIVMRPRYPEMPNGYRLASVVVQYGRP